MQTANFAAQLRRAGIAGRTAMTGNQREAASRKICAVLAALPVFQEADVVLLYRAVRAEVSLSALAQAAQQAGKLVAYPLCTAPGRMIALAPENDDAWQRGAFGIWEPVPERSVQLDGQALDLIVCPCAGFDSRCHRIGMGGGYYDRFLPSSRNAAVLAAAFETQREPEFVPQSWDVPMQAVVTELGVHTPDGCLHTAAEAAVGSTIFFGHS